MKRPWRGPARCYLVACSYQGCLLLTLGSLGCCNCTNSALSRSCFWPGLSC